MVARSLTRVLLLATVVATVGCAGPAPAPQSQPAPANQPNQQAQPAAQPRQESRTVKRIVATVLSEVRVLILAENFAVAGKAETLSLVHQGLVGLDESLALVPRLAEAVPTTENGMWKVFPDGRMETSWRIKDGIRWHDGAPFTVDDLVFTATVIRDREMGDLYTNDFSLIEEVEAVDGRTVRVTWARPHIKADLLFGIEGVPLPKHLLEASYQEDKSSLSALPYWSSGFVGTGPFKVKEWVLGSSQMTVVANDDYILGRPKIDEIEIRMLTDNNTMLANILAGEIDLTMGRNLSFEQAQTVRSQWKDGTVRVGPVANPMIIYPSFLYTDPLVIRDVRFRRAFLQAINRQELADSLIPGLSSVAHSVVSPTDPDYAALDSSIVKYSYDPPASIRAIEELGYTRGGDGMFRDRSGQALTVEMRTTSDNEIHMASFYPIIDYLKAVGIQVDPEVIPPARQRDLEYRAKLPGFQMTQGPAGLASFVNYLSSKQKTAENNWRGGHTGYANPEYDALVDRYFTTIPKADRIRAGGQALHHMTDQLVVMTTFYNTQPQIVSNRVKNAPNNASVANIYSWEIN